MKENVVAFIVARLSSSRLPKKQLKKIGSKRLIDWTIENVKKSKLIDKIVIATTDGKDNEKLIDVARKHSIDIFLYGGDINDVVGRLTKAADKYKADIPILISGDCPLIYPESLDKLIEKAIEDKDVDYMEFCKKKDKPAIHEGMSVYRKKCWELSDKISDKPNLREHQFPVVGMHPELFKIDCVEDNEIFYKFKHRLSVDTLADLKFMNTLYDELNKEGKEFNLKNVILLLEKKSEIMNINRDVHQMKIGEKAKKALFATNSEDNLELFFDLAYGLTKKGIGVRFFSENSNIKKIIKEKGFGVVEKIDEQRFDLKISDA